MGFLGNAVGSVLGGLTGGMAKGMTTQNGYQANEPDLMPNIQKGQTQINNNLTNEGNLATAYKQEMNGQGPNPAQAMLNNTTNKNIAQTTGMIASQKGINPAEAARTAAETGANLNQEAAGQGAAMEANQELNAQQGLAGLYGQEGGQELQNQSILQNANTAQNEINENVSAQNANAINQTQQGINNALGGVLQAGAAAFLNKGGVVPTKRSLAQALVQHFADGGSVLPLPLDDYSHTRVTDSMGRTPFSTWTFKAPTKTNLMDTATQGPTVAGGALDNTGMPNTVAPSALGSLDPATLTAAAPVMVANKGGQVPQPMRPSLAIMLMRQGGVVPGHDIVNHNSPKNDVVPAELSPNEIVLPLSVTQSKDAANKAKEFVEHLKRNHKPKGYAKVLAAKRKAK